MLARKISMRSVIMSSAAVRKCALPMAGSTIEKSKSCCAASLVLCLASVWMRSRCSSSAGLREWFRRCLTNSRRV